MNDKPAGTPAHLWIVAILAILWNAIGAFDYSATQLRLESYMNQFSQEQLDFFYSFPAWLDAAWAIAVWGSLIASFGLLLRMRWAVWLFGVAIVAMLITSVHNLVLSDGVTVMGEGAIAFSALIWVIALALYFYSAAMAKRGVLA